MTEGNGGPGQGSGAREFDLPAAMAGSVVDTPVAPLPGASPIVQSGIIMLVANAADDMIQWGRQSKMRDGQLRDFIPTESLFASALGIVAVRNAAFSWEVEGPKQLTAHVQDVLDHANMGKGWHDFILKVSVDLYTQDTGAFIEVIREGDSPEGALIGVNHLDAARCYHTGNPVTPVVYQDDVGKYHLLNWWQVVPLAELPSPDRRFKGLQWCALSRLMLAAQILKNTAILQREKTGGRSTRSIHMVKGMTTQQIEDAIEKVQIAADAAGLLRYLKPIIVGNTDPELQLDVKTLDLASLPDGYDPDKQNKWYVAQMAMAFLTDYQEFAPLPGGNLGTSAQSEVLHMKSRGKGPGLFMKLISHALNFYILPRAVSFAYDEQDLSAEGEEADVQKKRAETRKTRVESGEFTPEAARQDALDIGDMSQELFDLLGGQDVTPSVVVRDEEKGAKSLEPLLRGLGRRAAPVGQFLTTRIHRAFTTAADDLAALGYMDTPDRIKMSSLIGPVLKQLEDAMGSEVAGIVARNVEDDDARQVLAGMAQKAIGEEGSHSYRPFGSDATGTRADDGPARAGPFEDERLAAEAVFQDDMEKWLARVFAEVKRRLREESAQATMGPFSFGFREIKPNMFDQPEFWGFAQEELVKKAGPHIQQALLAGVQQAGRLGLAISFDQVNEQALKFAGDYTDDWWKHLKGSTQRGLRRAIQSNIKQGAPLSQLIKSLEPTFGRGRAEAIASTEITRMYAEANRMAYAEAGADQVEWRTVNDAKVDPVCDALHGERWAIGNERRVPPAHVGCRCWLAPVVCTETKDVGYREKQCQVLTQAASKTYPTVGADGRPLSAENSAVFWKAGMTQEKLDAIREGNAARALKRPVVTSAQTVFHETPVANAEAIQREGILVGKTANFEGSRSGVVYLAHQEELATHVGDVAAVYKGRSGRPSASFMPSVAERQVAVGERFVVFEVELPPSAVSLLKEDPDAIGGLMFAGRIKPEWLKRAEVWQVGKRMPERIGLLGQASGIREVGRVFYAPVSATFAKKLLRELADARKP